MASNSSALFWAVCAASSASPANCGHVVHPVAVEERVGERDERLTALARALGRSKSATSPFELLDGAIELAHGEVGQSEAAVQTRDEAIRSAAGRRCVSCKSRVKCAIASALA